MVRSIAKINDYVYIGTWSNIMFRRPANELFTSIEEVESLKGFKVFPNPTNAEISIQSNIEMHDLKYIIFSQLGIQVLTGHLTGKIGLVNIKPLPSGLYFLQLFGNKKNQIIKIIKN